MSLTYPAALPWVSSHCSGISIRSRSSFLRRGRHARALRPDVPARSSPNVTPRKPTLENPGDDLYTGYVGDWELLEAWRAGDESAAKALVEHYMDPLTRFFHKRVGQRDDASDLISETMLGCVQAKDRVHRDGSFRSFLFSIAINRLHRYYRKKAKRGRENDDFGVVFAAASDSPVSFASLVARQEQAHLVVRALKRLPLDQQVVFELSYIEDLDGTEIAEVLDIPRPTVYSRLRRGSEKLKRLIVQLARSPAELTSTSTGLETWADRVRAEVDT